MMTTYSQNWAFVFKQNAEQLSRWLWREPLALTIEVLVNKNPVNLYTDRDAQNFVGKKFSYDAGRGKIDLWFNTYLNPPTDDLTVELRHQTVTSWTVSWTMEVSGPITVPDPPVPDDPVIPDEPDPLESPRNVSATDGQYSDYR